MIRYLAPAPVQYDLGQQRQAATARFGSVLDINEVANDDGSKSIAVYSESAQPVAKVTAWRADVAAVAYSPDQTEANRATLLTRAQAALVTNATYLAIGSPTNAQVAAQVQTLTKECSALIRLLLGQLDSTSGT